MLLDVGTYRGLERLHVVVRDLVHQPSELGFLGREGVWPLRLVEDLSCNEFHPLQSSLCEILVNFISMPMHENAFTVIIVDEDPYNC